MAGAKVIGAKSPWSVNLYTDPRLPAPQPQPSTMTDASGMFQLRTSERSDGVVISCPQGFARATAKRLAESSRLTGIITLRPMNALHPIGPQKPKTAPPAPTTKAGK
ncbi:MAG TPA: hypothetical protein VGI81_03815 [Tepidisphaeraceae bacterium]